MKPVILIFIHYYLPGYRAGGPIRTIANLVEQLSAEFTFRIVTTDRDLGDVLPYEGVRVNEWVEVGSAQVLYLSPGSSSLGGIARIMRETPHDVQYLNSFFDPVFTLKPLMARYLGMAPSKPLIIAPRGEFSRGALIIKRWKKLPYMAVLKTIGIFGNSFWQASSACEASDIFRVLGGREGDEFSGRVLIASDFAIGFSGGNPVENVSSADLLPMATEPLESQPSQNLSQHGWKRELRICFLSRIVPMKNLDYALKVLHRVGVPVVFDIFGPQEEASYWLECQRLIDELPKNVAVTVHGSVEHRDVARTLAQYDLFFLPTRGENFGHVIFEALRAGTPVLISNETPWRQLDERGVGWEFPLSEPGSFANAIEALSTWSPVELDLARARAKIYAEEVGASGEVRAANIQLFNRVVESSICFG